MVRMAHVRSTIPGTQILTVGRQVQVFECTGSLQFTSTRCLVPRTTSPGIRIGRHAQARK